MVKERIKEILIHPGFSSLSFWLIFVLLVPLNFQKYKVKQVKDEYTSVNTSFYYCDLDSDGNSEQISIDLNDTERTKIIISKKGSILNQYNIPFHPAIVNKIYFNDYNNDRFKECYVFTFNQDTIFLSIIDPMKSRQILLNKRFIDIWRKAKNSTDSPEIFALETDDGQKNIYNDLIFFITTGYSKQPRNLYRYLINEDSLIKSPESGAVIQGCSISDISGDSLPELILNVAATGNFDGSFPFTDSLSWLMIMDYNLQFLFPPVNIGKNPSRVQILPFPIKNETFLLAFYNYFGSDDSQSSFFIFDSIGNKIKTIPVTDHEPRYSGIFLNKERKEQSFFLIKNRYGEIVEFDSCLQIINTLKIPQIISPDPIAEIDADFDGKKELVFSGIDRQTLIFVRNNFKHPVILQVNSGDYFPHFTPFIRTGDKPIVYAQFSDHGSYISYEKNPLYYLRIPLYIGIFFAIYLLISIIGSLQRYRLNLKKTDEMKMVSLQMKAIRNQIDPHFTLNVLNAIGSLYSNENNREKADYIFGKYARLIRQTVITSDKVIVTIGEELDFVRTYIEIEKFRVGDSFNYSVNIDQDSLIDTKIPGMLIHTFVENAIKYGIRHRLENGHLDIAVKTVGGDLNIIVEDNGPGLESQNHSETGTGKGLTILNELIELYYRLENIKISYTLGNILERDNIIVGTRAIIKIPLKSPKF